MTVLLMGSGMCEIFAMPSRPRVEIFASLFAFKVYAFNLFGAQQAVEHEQFMEGKN